MKNTADNSGQSAEIQTTYVPFVNEECGDTLWGEVLREAAERDARLIAANSNPR